MADLGKVSVTDGGDYSASVTYEHITFVHYLGDTYFTLKTVKGITPTDDGVNYRLFCKSAELATASKAGIVMPDGQTTSIDSKGKMSAKKATVDAPGIVKPASTDFTVATDATTKIKTNFTIATALAELTAGEAWSTMLGKIAKAIATLKTLNANALLKSMISTINVNDANKVPASSYIHTLVSRIGMGVALVRGDNLTAAVNELNSDMSRSKELEIPSGNSAHIYFTCPGSKRAVFAVSGAFGSDNTLHDVIPVNIPAITSTRLTTIANIKHLGSYMTMTIYAAKVSDGKYRIKLAGLTSSLHGIVFSNCLIDQITYGTD